jgi:hypothetical protein
LGAPIKAPPPPIARHYGAYKITAERLCGLSIRQHRIRFEHVALLERLVLDGFTLGWSDLRSKVEDTHVPVAIVSDPALVNSDGAVKRAKKTIVQTTCGPADPKSKGAKIVLPSRSTRNASVCW